MATLKGAGATPATVFEVNVRDASGSVTTLLDLAGTPRADLRFFTLPDMSAAVLLEGAGTAYRLTQVASIPVPAAGLILLSGIAALALRRRG